MGRDATALRRQPYLVCKVIGGREVAVTVYEHAPNNEYRIARRRYPLHSLRHRSLPTWPGDEVIARVRAGGPRADIGEVNVKRIGELHAVVAPEEIRHVQNLRSFMEV